VASLGGSVGLFLGFSFFDCLNAISRASSRSKKEEEHGNVPKCDTCEKAIPLNVNEKTLV